MSRIQHHPILGELPPGKEVTITVDGQSIPAFEGEMIAAALIAHGKGVFRRTSKRHEPRQIFCGIGRCTDCVMIVDGIPNIRTCITPVRPGMIIHTQEGTGKWGGQG